MIRHWLHASLLTGLMASAATAAPKLSSSESLGNVLKQKAQRVFELSDKNHDQVLDREEQADAEQRMGKVFRQLAQEHMLAGPKRVPPPVIEPVPIDPDQLSAPEFSQIFAARAAKFDADLRARRIANNQQPVVPLVVLIPVATYYDSRRDRSYRRDRDDWDDKPHHSHSRYQTGATSTAHGPALLTSSEAPASHGYSRIVRNQWTSPNPFSQGGYADGQGHTAWHGGSSRHNSSGWHNHSSGGTSGHHHQHQHQHRTGHHSGK